MRVATASPLALSNPGYFIGGHPSHERLASIARSRLRWRRLLAERLHRRLVVLLLDSPVLLRLGADRAAAILEGEEVGAVGRERGMESTATQTGLVGLECQHPSPLVVIPLDVGLDDDFPRISEGYAFAVAVVSAVDSSGLPAVESLVADAELAGEFESLHLLRLADKLLRIRGKSRRLS